ncbi:M4 family metallopeptidase [Hymenobacter sp. BT175]|uniref:M4 family metallopeptidase n=1 Tax=Hymenobacter translucens TaxID=2886507 RepID=UPI001D0F049D|nr:M4 family metallopeptidase [Hymenobacter translucens]MCC2545709.1 M4 family metallopeptidase [Hymenobacter translucens]
MKKHVYATLILLLGASPGLLAQQTASRASQPSLARLQESLRQAPNQTAGARVELNARMPAQAAISFDSRTLHADNAVGWLSQQLGLRPGTDQLRAGATTDAGAAVTVQKVQQYYQGYKVEHGGARIIAAGGQVASMQLEFYSIGNLSTTVSLSEGAALQQAMNHIGARRYVWQGYTGSNPEFQRPQGELVIVEDILHKQGGMRLAWKFDVYADEPLSRNYVYVDAASGQILLLDAIIKHANAAGAADSRYSGRVNITTDNSNSTHRLRETRNGHTITTLNYRQATRSTTADAAAVDFLDTDNNWTSAEFNNATWDNAALDVQFGTELVSDYWKLIHNRSSWNNAGGEMKSFVHVNQNYDNAFWSGSAMYYGDGSYLGTGNVNGFKPLTSLDIVAHEMGHGVCQATAGLVYARESGGLNEGFSDIWAACAENYSGLNKSYFLIGEEISATAGGFLRSMQNPNLASNPDTYEGDFWRTTTLPGCPYPSSSNDNCGVHYNSGVLNKWFYLITQGESGTNDKGNTFNVTGLGFAKTQRIAYLTELSLTSNSDYAAARTASINAAQTLFGACSNEVQQVTNAWFGVGVGESAACSPTVEFALGQNSISEAATLGSGCSATRTATASVKLSAPSAAATTVTFNLSGTGTQSQDYTISPTSLTFAAGQTGTQSVTVSVVDDMLTEGSETIVLGLVVAANGGTATTGLNNPTHTITIADNDAAPSPIGTTAITTDILLSENFDAALTFPTGWTQLRFSADVGTNVWTVGPYGGIGVTGNAAYITNSTNTKPYTYTTTATAARVLAGPTLNVTDYTDVKLSFTYKVEGEYYAGPPDGPAIYDYGRVGVIIGGSVFYLGPDRLNPYAYHGSGSAMVTVSNLDLSAVLGANTSFRPSFVWFNDNTATLGVPLLIDDVVVTGRRKGVAVATQVGQSAALPTAANTGDIYLKSNDLLLGRFGSLNQGVGCLTASVTQAGNGQADLVTPRGTFKRAQKVIRLLPGSGGSTATYDATFYYTAAELTGFADKTALKVLQVADGTDLSSTVGPGVARLITPSSVSYNSTSGVYTYTAPVTGFGQFTLSDGSTVLPVTLGKLAVTLRSSEALLTWETYTELNNEGFRVERSRDGSRFEPVGFVTGKGTTSQLSRYQFTDPGVLPGQLYYYRLQQKDFDGTVAYSNIVTVRTTGKGNLLASLYPNPARDQVYLTFTAAPARVSITLFGADGRKLRQLEVAQPGGAPVAIPVAGLPAGAYFLTVTDGTVVETHPLLKE